MSGPIEVTHIEIRRVQNGFVVMGVNYKQDYTFEARPIQRVSFVAQDLDALKTLIESIVTMAEVNWLPTADVPMIEMHRREVKEAEARDKAAIIKKEVEATLAPLQQIDPKVYAAVIADEMKRRGLGVAQPPPAEAVDRLRAYRKDPNIV